MKTAIKFIAPFSKLHLKSTQTLTQRSFLNAASAFLDYFTQIVVSFVITPLLVAGLGSALYGVWQILTRLVSYMSATDGKPTQALKWVIANHQNTDDHSINRRAIGSALGVWLMMLPVLIGVGGFVVWVAPSLTNTTDEWFTLVRVTCSVLVINLIFTGMVTIPAAVLRGMNLGYKRMGTVAGLNIIGGILMAGAIYLDFGLVGVAIAYLIQTILTGLTFWYLVKIYLPWFGADKVTFSEVKRFLRLSSWYAGWDVVSKLLLASDVILLGILISASAVTNYVLTGYAAQTLVAIITMMVGAAAPGLGGLVGKQQFDKVIDLRKEMLLMSCLFAGILGFMILMWNRSFITLWVGQEKYAGPWVNLLLVLIAIQLLFFRNETYLIDLTLDLRRKVILGFVATLVSVGLMILFTPLFGMSGLCLGILGGRLILSIGYPVITGQFLGVSLSDHFKPVFRPFLVMTGLFYFATYAGQKVVIESWLGMMMWGGISLLVISLVFFWTGFTKNQRSLLMSRVLKLMPSKNISNNLRAKMNGTP
jgi:O-antigen/teichoic acid export membrane protein